MMAAGEGRRLRPLTERYAKPVLPIDGRPGDRDAAPRAARGRDRARHGRHRPPRRAGRGAARRLSARAALRATARAARLGGRRPARARRTLPALVVAADTVFTPGDIGRFAATPGHAIAARRDPPPAPPHRYALGVEDGRVTQVLDDDPANPLAAAPLWRLGETLRPGAARRARRPAVRARARRSSG